MNYNNLGTSNLQVCPLGLGTVQMGLPYGIGLTSPPSDQECIRVLRHAVDAGINYFDTAPLYGRSEEIIGKAFSGTPNCRPIIATKFTIDQPEDSPPLRGKALQQHIEKSVTQSLTNLRLDALDLLQFHNAEGKFISPDFFETMHNLCRRGMVKYWGATTYGEANGMDILSSGGDFSTLQTTYSLLDRRLEKRLFPACKVRDTALILRSVFLKGILSDQAEALPTELADLQSEARKTAQIAAAAGLTLPKMALRFAAFCPYATVTLFGTTSIGETNANIEALEEGPLPAEVIEQLNELRIDDEQLLAPAYSSPGWA
ncbi:MAG: hypothetical protein CME16_00660 [Gemmatimonadetes bacterium]|nr:hypothetical protein [Gemmatimonadota bacterium]